MKYATATINTEIEVSPEVMAKAFWNMDAEEQALFFLKLAEVVEYECHNSPNPRWQAEKQFLAMRDEIRKLPKSAREMYMTMSVWAFDYVEPKLMGDL